MPATALPPPIIIPSGPASAGPLRLTPSRVAALRQCGFQQLWLARQPAPRFPFVETAATARGKSMHATLAAFHRAGGAARLTLDDLFRLLAQHWVRAGYPDEVEQGAARLRCEEELARYYAVFGHDGGTLATERTWHLRRNLDGLLTKWEGRLDWLRAWDGPEGGLEIVDWKASGPSSTPEALAADPVTTMYAWLGRSLANQHDRWPRSPVRFSLLYLGRAEKVTLALTREIIAAAEAELAALSRGLADDRLEPNEGVWCMWHGGCPVKRAGECPLFPAAPLEEEWT